MFDSIDILSLNFMKLYNWYLDNIFTINNPEFEKHFPDIYPAEFRMNKATISDIQTSIMDLNS